MGLSSEERLRYFYANAAAWRRSMVNLRNLADKRYRKTIGHWVNILDEMVGIQVQRSDSDSGYWLFGPSDDGFHSLHCQTYDLARKPHEPKEPEHGSLQWWTDDLSLKEAADLWTRGPFTHNKMVTAIAAWWAMWNWIPALFYPVNRYDDKLFVPRVKKLFVRLIGDVVSQRLTVLREWESDEQLRRVAEYEHALLCRYNLLRAMLQAEDHKHWKGALGTSERKRKAAFKATRVDPFDGKAFVETIGKMSLAEVKRHLEKFQEEARKLRYERPDNEPSKTDGILGPEPRSEKDLEKIIDEGTDYAEVEAAAEERETIYGTYYSGWKKRFEKKPRKKR